MDAVDAGTIASIIKSILGIASGGLASWIVTGVLLLLAGGIAWWINKKVKEAQNAANDAKRVANEGKTDSISGGGEQAWDKAAQKSEQDRAANPDDSKKPLDPVE